MPLLILIASFVVLAVASRQIGQSITRMNLPLITGYLFTGILVGPFVLDLIPREASDKLRFIDEISLGFIAFAAGSELYLKEIRDRLRSIAWTTAGLVVVVYSLGVVAIVMLADFIPFMSGMPAVSRVAIGLLGASILVARSPSSAIAIVNELRARGPFTKTVLGVTIVMDVVVIITFAISASIADVLLTATGFDPGFILLLTVELLLSAGIGLVVGRLLQVYLSARLHPALKTILMLLTGYSVFLLSEGLREFTHANLSVEILLEPLLICMVGSFTVTNFSQSRDEFLKILRDTGPVVYVAFFTLIGVTLRLDILAQTLLITVIIFGVRLVGLMIGSFLGGTLAGDPAGHNRVAWMAFITQAGIGLGLAKEAAVEFDVVGAEFSTMMISVIVLNQIVGPPFFKAVIKRVGEAHLPGMASPDETRDVLILGIEGTSRELAKQVAAHHWHVVLADTDRAHVQSTNESGIDERYIPEISAEAMRGLLTKATDAVVAMLDEDAANLKVCELAMEQFGIQRMVVRLNDLSWAGRFTEIGAMVVYPTAAMVHLLDHFVRAPHSVELLLDSDPTQEVVQVTINAPEVDGLPLRDLRLPDDVLVLGISRDGHSIVPHGYTILKLRDEVILIGGPDSLDQVTLRLGY